MKKLLDCIRDDMPFTEKDVLTFDELPKQVHDGLSKVILENLNISFEFYLREFGAKTQRKLDDLSQSMYNLTTDLKTELRAYRYDSAAWFHEPPINLSRFHYSNEKASFTGRKEQLERLRGFCRYNNSNRVGKDFAWWTVTGEGGSGKSRLCFEFLKQTAAEGWTICAQQNHSAEKLSRCCESLTKNTLFLLDYAEYDTTAVFRWIASFNSRRFNNIKIRILLIQRRGRWEDMREIIRRDLASIGFVEAALFDEEFLHIDKLDENEAKNRALLGKIQRSYVKNERGVELTGEETSKLYSLLQHVDKDLLRPLYAVIIADAYIQNKDIPLTWNKKDVLEYICEREIAQNQNINRELFGSDHRDEMKLIACTILSIATMTGGITFCTLQEMLPNEGWLNLSQHSAIRLCKNSSLFTSDIKDVLSCQAMEPDIIGEYFVLRQLREMKRINRSYELIQTGWRKPYFMSRFLSRLFQDHKELMEQECPELLTMLKKAELPQGIKKIEDYALDGCSRLTKIIMPDTVNSIGNRSFAYCSRLRQVVIPNSVTNIADRAFEGCYNLTTVTLPGSLTSIGEWAFDSCSMLKKVVIPDSITSIRDGTFEDCSSLAEIVIPDSIKSIGAWAFEGCRDLAKINIPNSVTSIGKYAFEMCSSLTEIEIPDSVTSIGVGAFSSCHRITKVVISNSITKIGQDAFTDDAFTDQFQFIVFVRGEITDVIRQAFPNTKAKIIFHEFKK